MIIHFHQLNVLFDTEKKKQRKMDVTFVKNFEKWTQIV